MIFEDDLIKGGDLGGRQASLMLKNAIMDCIRNEYKNVPLDSRVVCRIYANVRGLARVLVRKGTIPHVSVFEEFMCGFTQSPSLFDFIDVGPGKDRADTKIIGEKPTVCLTHTPSTDRTQQLSSSLLRTSIAGRYFSGAPTITVTPEPLKSMSWNNASFPRSLC